MREMVLGFGRIRADFHRLHRVGSMAAALILWLATPGHAQIWEITPSLTTSVLYTDNEPLLPKGEEEDAIITVVTPALAISGGTQRVSANIDAALDLRYQALFEDELDTEVSLGGFANVEWVESHLFTDFRASVSQVLVDQTEAAAADDDNNQNLDTVQTYEVSPYFLYDFANFASSQLRYQFGYVNSESDDISESYDHLVSLNIASGRDFARLRWGIDASGRREFRKGDDDIEADSAELNLRLVLHQTFSLLGAGGYNRFDDNDSEKFDEPIWQGGILWTPTRRAEVRLLYGRRSGFTSPSAFIRYDIGDRTRFTAEYTEGLDTGQTALLDNLAEIGEDEEGAQVNTRTRRSFQASSGITSLDDDTSRNKVATATLTTGFGRNTATLAFTYSERNKLDSPEDEKSTLASLDLSREFSRKITGDIGGSYVNARFYNGEPDHENYTGSLGLEYAFRDNVVTFARYSHTRRLAADEEDEYVENAFRIGLAIDF